MTLCLTNTLTRTKEAFTPANPDHVTMYVCGPTAYNPDPRRTRCPWRRGSGSGRWPGLAGIGQCRDVPTAFRIGQFGQRHTSDCCFHRGPTAARYLGSARRSILEVVGEVPSRPSPAAFAYYASAHIGLLSPGTNPLHLSTKTSTSRAPGFAVQPPVGDFAPYVRRGPPDRT